MKNDSFEFAFLGVFRSADSQQEKGGAGRTANTLKTLAQHGQP